MLIVIENEMTASTEDLLIMLATVRDSPFRSGYRYKPNCCQLSGPGGQYTRIVNLGTVQWQTPNPFELGRLSVGRPAGPSIDSYKALVSAVC